MRRDEAIGWIVWGGLTVVAALALVAVVVVLVGSIPLLIALFPLTLAAVATVVAVVWWRERQARKRR
ncbi:MAG: hypothetical protein RID91_04545 [Azospirillaceae bacterium]